MSEFDSALKNAIPESLMLSANARARRGQQDAAERAAAEEEKRNAERKSEAGSNLLLQALAGLSAATRSQTSQGQQAAIQARNSFTNQEPGISWAEAEKKAQEEKQRAQQEAEKLAAEYSNPENWAVEDPAIVDTGYGPVDMAYTDDLLASVSRQVRDKRMKNYVNPGNEMKAFLGAAKPEKLTQSEIYGQTANQAVADAVGSSEKIDNGSGANGGNGSAANGGNGSATNAGSGTKSGSKDSELTPEKSREENDNMFANDEVTTADNIWQPKEAQSDLAVAWFDSLGGDDEAMSNHLASSSLVYDEYRQLASTMPGYADSGFGQYDNLLDFQMYGSADEWLEWTKFANETQGYYKDLEGVDGYIDPDKFYEFYDMCKREYEISQVLGQNGALSPEEINMYSYLLLTDYQTCQAAAQYLIDSAAASGLDISSYLQANGVADQDTLARLLYLNSNSYGAVDKGADSYNEAYRLMAEEDAAAGLNPRQVEVGAYRPYAEGGVYTGNRRTPKALWSADTENRGGIGKAINEKGSELWNELNLDPNTKDEIEVADRNYIDKLLAANQYQLGYGSRYV